MLGEGTALLPLDEEQLRQAVRELRDEERVDAISICFLWSFRIPTTSAVAPRSWPRNGLTYSCRCRARLPGHARA